MSYVGCKLQHPLDLTDLGIVGQQGTHGFRVGDIVSITKRCGEIQYAVMVSKEGEFFPMGWRRADFKWLIEDLQMRLVRDYHHLNRNSMAKCKYKPYIV